VDEACITFQSRIRGVCLCADLCGCLRDLGQPFGERAEVETGATHNNGTRTVQKRCDFAQPMPNGIGRIIRHMTVKQVARARQIFIRGPCRQQTPAVKNLQRIRVHNDAALCFSQIQRKRGFPRGRGPGNDDGFVWINVDHFMPLTRTGRCEYWPILPTYGIPYLTGSAIEPFVLLGHFARKLKPYQNKGYTMADAEQATYKRVMLKISGEALMGDTSGGLHPPTVQRIAREVKTVHDMGVEICMVIGGGNIFRGLQGSAQGMERTTADYMGMLATVMNALAMQSALEELGIHTRVISAITMNEVAEPYIRRRAVRHLEKKRVCIFAAGTGNPYFTTDTAATLRANEMNCEAIFKGTKVDGVYDKDPSKHADAKRYDKVSYDEVLQQHLGVMDASAIALARDNHLPIVVFSLDEPGGFRGILAGDGTYTVVHD